MANDFYNNDNPATELQDGTLATAVGVEEKFDEVAAGFTLVNAETDNGITLSNVDVTTRDIPDAIAARANNMLGFDSTGELGLQVRKGTFKGDWTTTTFYYQDDLVRDSGNALGYGTNSIIVANVNHTSTTLVGDTASWDIVYRGDWWISNSGNAANPMTGPMFVETGAFGYYVGGASDTYGSSFTVSGATGKVTINHTNNGLGSDIILDSVVNGATSLYHNGSKKFETSSVGADIVSDNSASVVLGLRGSTDAVGGGNIFFENSSEELQGVITNNLANDTLQIMKTNDLLGDQVTMTFHATGLVEFESISNEAVINLKPALSGGGSGIVLYDDSGVARGYMNMSTDTGLIGLSSFSALGSLQTGMYLTTDGNVNVNGASPTADSHLTRKDYVDDKFSGITGGTFTTTDGKTVTYNADGLITSVV